MDDIPRNFWYRVLEILPGALSWLVLTVPFIASFWYPREVAIFIIIYVLFWFLRSLKSGAFLIHSYFKHRRFEKLDWNHLLEFFSDNPPLARTEMEKETAERIAILRSKGLFKKAEDIRHVVIMPTYKEEKEVLESSIAAITESRFPLDRILIVLATEERDRERAEENAAYLKKRFKNTFGGFIHVMHPKDLPGEIAAKGANISYAGRHTAELLKEHNADFSNILVTTLDADNRPHPTYFANLTYHYLMEINRGKKSYQPLSFFYNNIWDVPFANRLIALVNTFWYLSESGEPHHLYNAAVYAQSLDALHSMNFWSRQTIVEDLHQYWRSYFHFRGDYEVIPLFVPVYQDALQSKTYFTSLAGQYTQLRRWAWGCSEIAYAAAKMFAMRGQLPRFKNFLRLSYLWYLQTIWATAPVIILLNQFIPTFVNPEFAKSLFAYNLGQIFAAIFTIMALVIFASLLIILLSLPHPRGRGAKWKFLSTFLQWPILPLVTFVYGAIPAIDAQTRLMLNKRLGFVVTEKIRKIS